MTYKRKKNILSSWKQPESETSSQQQRGPGGAFCLSTAEAKTQTHRPGRDPAALAGRWQEPVQGLPRSQGFRLEPTPATGDRTEASTLARLSTEGRSARPPSLRSETVRGAASLPPSVFRNDHGLAARDFLYHRYRPVVHESPVACLNFAG